MHRSLLISLLATLLSSSLHAQLVIENDQTVAWYVENILLGNGVTAQNITFNGQPADEINVQCGLFNSTNANVGIDEGMIISSGGVIGALGPNNSASSTIATGTLDNVSDPDLFEIAGNTIFDAAILEFDFIPQGDTLSFGYVFGSEEYPEFVNQGVNDAFGFFVAGPGLSGPYTSPAGFPNGSTNIALIPGTTVPVSIDDVNELSNSAYYVANGDGIEAPYSVEDTYIQYDGLTVPLTAITEVECGEVYHIKIVIGDAGDNIYDSAVFLQAGSFSSNLQVEAELDFDIDDSFTDNTLFEGCFEGTLVFSRYSNISNSYTINLAVTGTASNGIDYTEIPTALTFAPGDSTVSMTISAFLDGIDEGTETVTLEILTNQNICGSNDPSYFSFDIADSAPPIILEDQSIDIDCNEVIDIGTQATGGFGMFTYSWDTGASTDSITVGPSITTLYTLTVIDSCVTDPATAEFTVNVPVYPDVIVEIPDNLVVLECGITDASFSSISEGGNGPLMLQWSVGGVPFSDQSSIDYTTTTASELTLVATDQCGSSNAATANIDIIPYTPPMVDLQAMYETDCTQPDLTITPLSVSGGQGDFMYEWSVNGAVQVAGTELPVTTSVDITALDILLTVTDECGSVFSDESFVEYQQAPPINILVPSGIELYCEDPTVEIMTASVTGGQDSNVSYVWYTEEGIILGNDLDLLTSTTSDTYYIIEVTDICGYQANETVPVTVIPYVPLDIETIGDTLVCAGAPVELSSGTSGGLAPVSYDWSHGLPNDATVTASPESSEVYTVTATDACNNTVAGNVNVLVSEVHALFDLSMEGFHGFETTNLSSYIIDDQVSYTWYIDGEAVSDSFELAMQYPDIDDHIVALVMENSAGCTDSIHVQTLGPPTLYVPNSFTPNDDGVNDRFQVKGSNITSFKMKIYDRWGNIVFESFELGNTWNGAGRAESNYYGDTELYSYRIVAQGRDGDFYKEEGTITLIR